MRRPTCAVPIGAASPGPHSSAPRPSCRLGPFTFGYKLNEQSPQTRAFRLRIVRLAIRCNTNRGVGEMKIKSMRWAFVALLAAASPALWAAPSVQADDAVE